LAVGTGLRWIAVAAAVEPSSLILWLIALFTFFLQLAVWTGQISALVAIGCSLMPGSSEAHPLAAFLKILFAAVG